MSEKWSGGIRLTPVGGAAEVTSVPGLLRHLDIEDAPRAEQEAGIRAWLPDHDVYPLMAHGLRKRGFGHLIDEIAKPVAGRMDGGELQMVREYLGLTIDNLAGLLGVNPRTVRSWESGRDWIPNRIRREVELIERETAAAVGELVDALNDATDPVVAVYRADADMHAARPDCAHLPARWWRMVVARATHEVPGVVIVSE